MSAFFVSSFSYVIPTFSSSILAFWVFAHLISFCSGFSVARERVLVIPLF